MDECCLLPSQLLVPNLDWLPASDGLVSRLQPKQPLRLCFGRAPTLPSSTSTLQLDGLARCALPIQPSLRPANLGLPCSCEGLHPTGSHQVSALSENFVFHLCCMHRGVWFCPVEPRLASDSV